MKKISLLVLIFVLATIPSVSLYSCDNTRHLHTIVGEIVYVKSHRHHAVYISPYGQEDVKLWVPMMITPETETVSEFNEDVSKMPELAVGNLVEIVYDTKNTKANHILVGGSKTVSLKIVSPEEGYEKVAFDMKLRHDYEYSRLVDFGVFDLGTVVHIAKIEEPDNGYFVYVENNKYDEYSKLTVYWLDEDSMYMSEGGVLMDDKTIELVKSGKSGFYAEITSFDLYRFENVGIQTIHAFAVIESE